MKYKPELIKEASKLENKIADKNKKIAQKARDTKIFAIITVFAGIISMYAVCNSIRLPNITINGTFTIRGRLLQQLPMYILLGLTFHKFYDLWSSDRERIDLEKKLDGLRNEQSITNKKINSVNKTVRVKIRKPKNETNKTIVTRVEIPETQKPETSSSSSAAQQGLGLNFFAKESKGEQNNKAEIFIDTAKNLIHKIQKLHNHNQNTTKLIDQAYRALDNATASASRQDLIDQIIELRNELNTLTTTNDHQISQKI